MFPAFRASGLHSLVEQGATVDEYGHPVDLLNKRHLFMRWKESYFLKVAEESRITIAGFYYICFDRGGKIEGFYFDPLSQPFQQVILQVDTATPCPSKGYSFPTFQFA
eukprot:TRINITY_DN1731_c0_g1_i1.p1 TRINITY_DN1731_c0_g1~~TRINITY_DN1731_c0_g1_i1.p1  ORF type:complete len:108 (+),score=14.62 TRINITY_DN1731_c0_g1_i1:670-993(+)